jgi:hypothetical protein
LSELVPLLTTTLVGCALLALAFPALIRYDSRARAAAHA